MVTHKITLACLLLTTCTIASAQTSYPMVMGLKPVAVQAGTTAECEVQSRYTMLGTHQVFVSGEGVTAEVIAPEMPELKPGEKPKDLTKLKLKITVATDALPGPREFRLATPNGASTIGQLVVVRDPVTMEPTGDNNTPDKAQEVTLPATMCGVIEKSEDTDFWKFHVEAGQSFTFLVRGQRLEDKIHDLQNHIDPILFLRDASGSVVAMSDNFFYADPFLAHTFAQSGEYTLEIRDVRYQGNVYWEYAIEAHARPVIAQVTPLAVNPDQATDVQLTGWNLGDTKSGQLLAAAGSLGQRWLTLPLADGPSNPVPVYVTDQPVFAEPATENDTAEQAVAITTPVVINGRMEKTSDVDVYTFEAKKGDQLSFEVLARRYDSQLDSLVRILNEKGQLLKEEDDSRSGKLTYADSWIEGWTAPADGKYFVEIRDVHLRGGDGFGYALAITPTKPYFELQVDTDKTNLTPGTHGVIFVRAIRKHGFTGEIELAVDGLPAGVTATCGRILPGKPVDGAIILSAAPDAPLEMARITIRGTAAHPQGEGQPPLELVAQASPWQEIYMPGGGRGHYMSDDHVVCVGEPSDIRSITLSTTEVRLKPGESQAIQVKLERAPDVKANITLDCLFQHLNSVFANTLPEGVTIDGSKSKTLLSNGASEGLIVLKADKTAPPVEKQVCSVMANFAINFVMKATYSSPPVFVSVEAAK
ncbi:hypothetical protein GC163_07035 [bacterium]|nr:hypothetical protein [bacterium]